MEYSPSTLFHEGVHSFNSVPRGSTVLQLWSMRDYSPSTLFHEGVQSFNSGPWGSTVFQLCFTKEYSPSTLVHEGVRSFNSDPVLSNRLGVCVPPDHLRTGPCPWVLVPWSRWGGGSRRWWPGGWPPRRRPPPPGRTAASAPADGVGGLDEIVEMTEKIRIGRKRLRRGHWRFEEGGKKRL